MAAGAVAEPPCVVKKKLMGGTSPSASCREREGGGFTAWADLGRDQAGRPCSTVCFLFFLFV